MLSSGVVDFTQISHEGGPMQEEIQAQTKPVFDLYAPTSDKFIGVISIPHSGENIPPLFEDYLTKEQRHRFEDVDTKVDQLVDIKKLQEKGIAVIVAHTQRICVDLNRAPELCVLNWKQNSMGQPLVLKEVSKELEQELVAKYHAPYFETIKSLINNLERKMLKPSFIDLHSMPSKPTEYHLKITPNQALERPDFCVSDVSGTTCEKNFINFICDQLKKTYPLVNQNDPYYGGYITRHVDELFPTANNIQIEIKRGNYLNEVSKELIPDKVAKMKPTLTEALIATFENFFEKYKN